MEKRGITHLFLASALSSSSFRIMWESLFTRVLLYIYILITNPGLETSIFFKLLMNNIYLLSLYDIFI